MELLQQWRLGERKEWRLLVRNVRLAKAASCWPVAILEDYLVSLINTPLPEISLLRGPQVALGRNQVQKAGLVCTHFNSKHKPTQGQHLQWFYRSHEYPQHILGVV